MTYPQKYKIDKEKKHIEINYKFMNCGEFLRVIDSIDNIDGWTIHFDFSGKGDKND